MCFDLADPRGSGGAGWPVKGSGQEEGAASSEWMAMAAASAGVMSEYYQAQELSTMVSALTDVVAGGPWGGAAAAPRGSGWEEQAMHGSYPGATSPEFAGTAGNQGTLLPFYGGGMTSNPYGGGGVMSSNPYGGGGVMSNPYGGGVGNTSGFLGSSYSFPTSSVSVATVPSSASGHYYSSSHDSQHQGDAAAEWNWENALAYPATTASWSDSSQYPPPPQ
ncbi:hypothetical protein EJB05_18312, partial [Eragrostis curvula]